MMYQSFDLIVSEHCSSFQLRAKKKLMWDIGKASKFKSAIRQLNKSRHLLSGFLVYPCLFPTRCWTLFCYSKNSCHSVAWQRHVKKWYFFMHIEPLVCCLNSPYTCVCSLFWLPCRIKTRCAIVPKFFSRLVASIWSNILFYSRDANFLSNMLLL